MENELKPCPNPFCKSSDVSCIGDDCGAVVECAKCHSSVTMESRGMAICVWNGHGATLRGEEHYGVFTFDNKLCSYTMPTNRGYDLSFAGLFKTEADAHQFKKYLEAVARESCPSSDWATWYIVKPVIAEVVNG